MSDDCISRQAVLDVLTRNRVHFVNMIKITSELKALPPVAPQPKTGHWIEVIDEVNEYGNKTYHHECSECGSNKSGWGEYDYCPNCGARMVEPQESEVSNADSN